MVIRRSLLPAIAITPPPDPDGDVVVTLKGMPSWRLVARGKTLGEAVSKLGELIVQTETEEEARCRVINSAGRATPDIRALT
jgi:hypothetical protein